MKTIEDVLRYLNAYNDGEHTATHLKCALIKRLIAPDSNEDGNQEPSPSDIREQLDKIIAIFRYVNEKSAVHLYNAALEIDWNTFNEAYNHCAERFELK